MDALWKVPEVPSLIKIGEVSILRNVLLASFSTTKMDS